MISGALQIARAAEWGDRRQCASGARGENGKFSGMSGCERMQTDIGVRVRRGRLRRHLSRTTPHGMGFEPSPKGHSLPEHAPRDAASPIAD